MAKSILPPLTPTEIEDRDHQERLLNKALSACWHGDDLDRERVEKCLFAYAVEMFKTVDATYRSKPGFKEKWFSEIEYEAVFRVLHVYSGHSFYGMSSLNEVANGLRTAIREHRKSLALRNGARVTGGTVPPLSARLRALKEESRLSEQKIADEIGVDIRTVQRHLAGTIPRLAQVAAYEALFTKRLKRPITLETP